jgi:two-component system OmpR family response regulator
MSNRTRLLMVEDNTEHIDLCREYLPLESYELDASLTGCDALEKMQVNDYDLIILDYSLPDMTGLEVLRRMKMLGMNVPVVFVSAKNEPDLSFLALKEGACDYIVKTYGYYQTLKDRIEENLEACEVRRKR